MLVGTGPSQPEDVQAIQVLSKGWLTDMYANAVYDENLRTGIYGAPRKLLETPTDAATFAHAYALPTPFHQFSPIDLVVRDILRLAGTFNFATCAAAPEYADQRAVDDGSPTARESTAAKSLCLS
jgi:hypothetical protein